MKFPTLMIALVLILTSMTVQAQEGVDPIPSPTPPVEVSQLDLNRFQVSAHSRFMMNGLPYSRLDFELKPEYRFDHRDALLLGNIAATGAATYGVIAWNPNQDKVRHFLAGYVVGNVSNAAFQLILPEKTKHRRLISALIGFGAGALVGIGKEVYDAQGYGIPSFKDAAATALGAGVGTLTISFDLKRVFQKRDPVLY